MKYVVFAVSVAFLCCPRQCDCVCSRLCMFVRCLCPCVCLCVPVCRDLFGSFASGNRNPQISKAKHRVPDYLIVIND